MFLGLTVFCFLRLIDIDTLINPNILSKRANLQSKFCINSKLLLLRQYFQQNYNSFFCTNFQANGNISFSLAFFCIYFSLYPYHLIKDIVFSSIFSLMNFLLGTSKKGLLIIYKNISSIPFNRSYISSLLFFKRLHRHSHRAACAPVLLFQNV